MLNYQKLYSCCFTGHRTIAQGDLAKVITGLDDSVKDVMNRGITNFITGGATGFDTVAAGTVLKYKKQGYPITLTLALPCEDQWKMWNENQISTYEFIRNNADAEVFIEEKYTASCMRKRNDYMVKNASICISYFRRERTGTSYTVRQANAKGLEVILL